MANGQKKLYEVVKSSVGRQKSGGQKKRVVIKKTVYESSIGVTKLTPGAEIYIVLPLGPNEPQHWCHNFCTNFILHINHRPEKTTITTPLCIPNESKNMLVSLKMDVLLF